MSTCPSACNKLPCLHFPCWQLKTSHGFKFCNNKQMFHFTKKLFVTQLTLHADDEGRGVRILIDVNKVSKVAKSDVTVVTYEGDMLSIDYVHLNRGMACEWLVHNSMCVCGGLCCMNCPALLSHGSLGLNWKSPPPITDGLCPFQQEARAELSLPSLSTSSSVFF